MSWNNFKRVSKNLLGSFRFDWRHLLYPSTIDEKLDNNQLREHKKRNIIWRSIFGLLALLTAIYYYPNIKGMISGVVLVFVMFVAFCAIMNSLSIKKSPAGRIPKKKPESLKEAFRKEKDFGIFNNFITQTYNSDKPLDGPGCISLIEVLIEKDLLFNKSKSPMADLIIKQYKENGILSFTSPRAVTKAGIDDFTKKAFIDHLEKNKKEDEFHSSSK